MTALVALAPADMQRGADPRLLFDELKLVIGTAMNGHPRSHQKAIGPSEAGEPCARRLAYRMLGGNGGASGWRPTVGTAVHSWLEGAVAFWNAQQDPAAGPRFVSEVKVNAGRWAGGDLNGTTDLVDLVTCSSIDWKVVGPSSLKKLGTAFRMGRGPGLRYEVQLMLYAAGLRAQGIQIDTVHLVALPAAGELDDAVHWSAPYDQAVVDAAFARLNRIHAIVTSLGAGGLAVTNEQLASIGADDLVDPDGATQAPAIGRNTEGCRFCPSLVPGSTDLAVGCPGAVTEQPTLTADPFA